MSAHPALPFEPGPAHAAPFAAGVVPRAVVATRPARDLVCASLFLRRDLSEEALLEPAEPVFSAADVQAAYRKGREEGHAAGLADAEASRAVLETNTLAAIAAAVAQAGGTVAGVADAAALAFARAVLDAMELTVPGLIAESAVGEVATMVAAILPGLAREPDLTVTVAADLADALAARLDALHAEARCRITVAPGAGLAPGAARAVWSSGQAERTPQDVWNQVLGALRVQIDATTKETAP